MSMIKFDEDKHQQIAIPLLLKIGSNNLAAARIDENEMLFHGGAQDDEYFADATILDIRTGQFQVLPQSKEKRRFHAAIVYNDFAYLFGGFNGLASLSSCERLDVKNRAGGWEFTFPLPQSSHCNMASIINKIIFISGYHISRVSAFDGEKYQISLSLEQNQYKILMGNFIIVNGFLYELLDDGWRRFEQNAVNPTHPSMYQVAKHGEHYYCHENSGRLIRLNANTRVVDTCGFF